MKLLASGFRVAVSLLVTSVYVFHLWKWFVVPLGVVPITYAQGAGLSLLFFIASPWSVTQELASDKILDEEYSKTLRWFVVLFTESVAFGMGYICHLL